MNLIDRAKKYVNDKGGLWATGRIDVRLFIFLVILMIAGTIMLYSASYVYAASDPDAGYRPDYYFKKQLAGILFGGFFMLAATVLNYKIFEDAAAYIGTGVSFVFLLLALRQEMHNGTQRHFKIAGIQFQPSDVAKFAIILTLAMLLDKWHDNIVSKTPLKAKYFAKINSLVGRPLFNKSLLPIMICGVLILTYALLIYKGSHLSGTILIFVISVAMLYFGEIRGKWFILGAICLVIVIVIALKNDVLKGYMVDRIIAWKKKDADPTGDRWQINQSLFAISSGGLFGKGFGNSTLKHNYLPEPHNDMVFSIVLEELGFVCGSLIVIVFALVIWRCFVIGINCPDRYGAMIAMGVAVQFGLQTFLNIAVATDLLPNTGIGLPFFSYGRTALLINMFEMGFVLCISRSSRIKKDM